MPSPRTRRDAVLVAALLSGAMLASAVACSERQPAATPENISAILVLSPGSAPQSPSARSESTWPVGAEAVQLASADERIGQSAFDISNARSSDAATPAGLSLLQSWGWLPAGSTGVPAIFWRSLNGRAAGSSSVVPRTSEIEEAIPVANTMPASGTAIAQGRWSDESEIHASLNSIGFAAWKLEVSLVAPQSLAPAVYWLATHDGAFGGNTTVALLWKTAQAVQRTQFAEDFHPGNARADEHRGDNPAFDRRKEKDPPVSSVPEPGTMALLGTGLVGLAGAARRRFRA